MRWVPALAVVLVACTGTPSPDSSTTTSEPATTTSVQTGGAVCLTGDDPFLADGAIGALTASGVDAAVITRMSWQDFGACERLEIDLGTSGGAPALEAPAVAGFFIRDAGVLRITLGPTVESSHLTDYLIETTLMDRLFVVRSLDGSLFVDIHMSAPVLARVSSARSPARAIIDLRPGGTGYPNAAKYSPSVVIVEPAGGAVSYPFSVGGYVKGDVGVVEASLVGTDGASTETSTPPAADLDLWRSFVILFPNGPIGDLRLDISGLAEVAIEAR